MAKRASVKAGSNRKPAVKKSIPKKQVTIRPARPRRIDVALKGLAQTEPPIDNDPSHLDGGFLTRLQAALASLAAAGTPFRLVEGFRTVNRQQWLYGSGRPSAVPYGRSGPILTQADGVNNRSNHQGDGSVGSGRAADCYPLRNGSVYIPPATDQVWEAYATAVEQQGLTAGLRFSSVDAPHSEMN